MESIVLKCINCKGKNHLGESERRVPFTEVYIIRRGSIERPYILSEGRLENAALCPFLTKNFEKPNDMCKAGNETDSKRWGYCPYVNVG